MTNKKNILIILFLFLTTISLLGSKTDNLSPAENFGYYEEFSRGKAGLKGIVKDEGGNPTKNALVVLTHEDGVSKFVQRSNEKGEWGFNRLGTGKFAISINFKGYKPFKSIRNVSISNSDSLVECILKKETNKKKTVIVNKLNKDKFTIEFKQLSHKTPGAIGINEKVYVLFNYKIPENYTDGVYIWVIPVKKRYLGRKLQASALITRKTGTLTRYFSITDGNRKIDKIKIIMMDKNRDKILAKHMIKVNYLTNPKMKTGGRTNFGDFQGLLY